MQPGHWEKNSVTIFRNHKKEDLKRIAEFDSIRAISIILILSQHLFPKKFAFLSGVDLFLVLSGYLVIRIIFEYKDGPNFKRNFYFRRILRTWPIYYLTILAVGFCNSTSPRSIFTEGWPSLFTWTQFWERYAHLKTLKYHPSLFHTWTIALEEQFYFIAPLVLSRWGLKIRCSLLLLALTLSISLRAMGFHHFLLLAHLDGLALGGLLAHIFSTRSDQQARAVLRPILLIAATGTLIAIFMVGPSLFDLKEFPTLSITIRSVLGFTIVGAVIIYAGSPFTKILRIRWLCYIGTISYGLYLFHYPIYFYVDEWLAYTFQLTFWWKVTAKLVFTFVAAILSWELIERRILTLKKYFPRTGVKRRVLLSSFLKISPRIQ